MKSTTANTGDKALDKQLNRVSLQVTRVVILMVTIVMVICAGVVTYIAYTSAVDTAHSDAMRSMSIACQYMDEQLSQIELATQTTARQASQVISSNDSQSPYTLLRDLIFLAPDLSSAAIMFRENYYPSMGREYAPAMLNNDSLFSFEHYNAVASGFHYLDDPGEFNWIESSQGRSYWCEPYVHSRDNQLYVAYSTPIYDGDSTIIGVLLAAIELSWLQHMFDALKPTEDSWGVMISRDGYFICHPDSSLVMTLNVYDSIANTGYVKGIDVMERMRAGETGMAVWHYAGTHDFVYFTPVHSTGWNLLMSYDIRNILRQPRTLVIWMVSIFAIALIVLFFLARKGILGKIRPFSLYLKKVSKEGAVIERELQIASAVQTGMIPHDFSAITEDSRLDVYGLLQPAKVVSGDLYDFFIRDNRLYFSLGDVSGKGIPASLFMAVTGTLFRTLSRYQTDPVTLLQAINKHLSKTNSRNLFCTMFIGVMDLSTGRVRYCNAGHNAPALCSKSEAKVEFLRCATNLPLGVMEDHVFEGGEFVMQSGDALLLYTDGITEAEDSALSLYGESRLLAMLHSQLQIPFASSASSNSKLTSSPQSDPISSPQSNSTISSQSAETLVNSILLDVQSFTQDAEQNDDITMLCIRYLGK